MNDFSPPQLFTLILHILNGREIVLVLLHGRDPGNIVEGHDLESEVLIVFDLLDGFKEGVEIGGRLVVDVCQEVGWREAYNKGC